VADGLVDSFPPVRHEAEVAAPTTLWRRRRVVVSALVALGCVIAAVALFATRDSSSGLSGIQPDHVGVIDPQANEIVQDIQVGLRPGPVAAGDGFVWVGNLQDQTLTKIDARRRSLAGNVPLESRTPTGLAVGFDAAWVAYGRRGQLAKVDPQFDRASPPIDAAGNSFGSQSGAVAVGEGSVWVVFGNSTLARVEPRSLRVAGTTLAGWQPSAVTTGAGSIWVANSGDATVSRFNPVTFEEGPVHAPYTVGRKPAGIAFGYGVIWVACALDDSVTRIDPSSGSTVTIPVGDGPVAVAVGAGAVWVANGAGRSISRIDPSKKKVVSTIEVRTAPAGIAVADGMVWVTAQAP
jgi:streptogramin lyase